MDGATSAADWVVTPIDATDDQQYDAWYAVVAASHEPLRPGEPGWQAPELRACMVFEECPERSLPLAVVDAGGTVLAAGCADISRHDNPHLALLSVWVLPGVRRRGVGSALLEGLERLAAAEGCTTVAAWKDESLAERGRGIGRRFAEHHGYEMVQNSPRRDLTVPIDPEVRDALMADCERHAEGYRAETFTGPWPAAHVAARAEFGYRMSTDTPRGDFAREDEVWDAARVRQSETMLELQNRLHVVAVVVEEKTGDAVGFSEIAVPRGAPSLAYQHDTLIMGEHRGHRLGTLVKLANLEELARSSPQTSVVVTHNASDNDPMISVNEALGCELMADGLTWQKRLA